MREFVYYSGTARTSGNFDVHNLMDAGRMDIACHVVVSSFFLSHKLRDNVKLHLVFYGPPTPPRHLEIFPGKSIPETGSKVGSVDISKKDVAGLIRRVLFKYKEGKKNEVFNGVFVDNANLFGVLKELEDNGKTIYVLDDRGEDIRTAKIEKDCVFVLGDHKGLPLKELKRLKKSAVPISIGKEMYFASQVVAIVNNELDRRGI